MFGKKTSVILSIGTHKTKVDSIRAIVDQENDQIYQALFDINEDTSNCDSDSYQDYLLCIDIGKEP